MSASKKSVFQKLGVKPAQRAVILHLPKSVKLGEPPAGAKIQGRISGTHDLILAFYESSRDLKGDLPAMKKALEKTGAAWIAYRKGGTTDLSRDSLWKLTPEFGLEGVSMISIDDDWSGFKLMYPKTERK